MPASIQKFPGDDMWDKVVRFNIWSFSQLIADPYMQVRTLGGVTDRRGAFRVRFWACRAVRGVQVVFRWL